MWAIKRPRKLVALNQIDELNAILLKNEQANLLDTKTREEILLKEKNDAKGDYEKLLVTYNKLEKDNQELKTAIANLLSEYNIQIKKQEDNNSTLEKYLSDLSKQNLKLNEEKEKVKEEKEKIKKEHEKLKKEYEKLKTALPPYLKKQLKIEN
jgi:lipopolysaccharide biosynthesis regulator YciM